MKKWGFKRGKYNPCLYFHEEWNVKVLVHGDDFVSVGTRSQVNKFKDKLEGRFELHRIESAKDEMRRRKRGYSIELSESLMAAGNMSPISDMPS